MSRRAIPAVLALAVVALALSACGRKATEADCMVIVDQMVVVKMKKKNANPDPAAVQKLQSELREEAKGEIMDSCVGKRISDGALDCIKKAETEEEIIKCMR